MKVINYILPLCGLLAFTACQQKNTTTAKKEQKELLVSTSRSIAGTYQTSLEFDGIIKASKAANLGASLPGKVEKINYKEGDFVKKGSVIAELSGEMLTQAQVENNAIRKDFERVERLLKKGSVTQQDYDHIKAKLDASDAKVTQLRKATMVIAPFSGYITDQLMEVGETFFINIPLDPGYSHASGIVRLMNLSTVVAEIEVNETDLPLLKEGMPVNIKSDTYPEVVFNGVIQNIKMMLSSTTHSSTVSIKIDNNDLKLKPGMFVSTLITQEPREGVKVPMGAIYRQAGTANDYIFKVNPDKTVTKLKIERIEDLGDTIVVNKLTGNEVIVTNGKNNLTDGLKIRIN